MKKLNIEFQELPYAVEEAMNRLRINIKFCGKNTRKILITSSMPNEGKSSVAINLWKMLAEAGFPAVLVDVDLRKSVIKDRHHIKDADKLPDLGYFLSGQSEMEKAAFSAGFIFFICLPYKISAAPSAPITAISAVGHA